MTHDVHGRDSRLLKDLEFKNEMAFHQLDAWIVGN
jgi:hypothetical protein